MLTWNTTERQIKIAKYCKIIHPLKWIKLAVWALQNNFDTYVKHSSLII